MATLEEIEVVLTGSLRRMLQPLEAEVARLSEEVYMLRKALVPEEGGAELSPNAAGAQNAAAPAAAVVPPSPQERRLEGKRAVETSYDSTPLLTVGKNVRVEAAGETQRAMILCTDGDTADVEIETAEGLQELQVAATALRPLEPFELRSPKETQAILEMAQGAEAIKEEANALFTLKDYVAAMGHYTLAVDYLRSKKSTRVVINSGRTLLAEDVHWVKDVALCVGGGRRLDASQVINVHDTPTQTALYLNRARCFCAVNDNQRAAQDFSVVVAMLHDPRPTLMAEPQRLERLHKAYYLRSKTRLKRQKFDAAHQDVAACMALEVPDTSAMLRQMEREIDVQRQEMIRSNKKIAKEVSKWADQAFTSMKM